MVVLLEKNSHRLRTPCVGFNMGGHKSDVLVGVQPIFCIAHRLYFALCPTLGVGAFADLSEFKDIVHGSNYWVEFGFEIADLDLEASCRSCSLAQA